MMVVNCLYDFRATIPLFVSSVFFLGAKYANIITFASAIVQTLVCLLVAGSVGP
jgi:hypothetical protein